MRSPAWGNQDFEIVASHNQLATWNADYSYAKQLGLSGTTHPGWDVTMPVGTRLYALADGRVDWIRSEDYATGTKEIVILTDGGDRHLYTHTSKRDVTAGQRVTAGQLIGRSGDPTGLPHLHFEHRVPDSSTRSGWRIVDPEPLLTGATTPASDDETVYTPQSSVVGEILGTPEAWIAWAEDNGVQRLDEFAAYVHRIYELAAIRKGAGPQPHKLINQFLHETAGGTSEAWVKCLNPAGIGVTSDAERLWYTFRDGVQAANAHYHHASHYSDYPLVPDIAALAPDNPRNGSLPESFRGTRKTLESYGDPDWRANPTWATDADYGEKWARWLNRTREVFAGVAYDPDPVPDTGGDEGRPDVAGYTAHNFPGFPNNPVYLPDWIDVQIKIIPSSVAGWTSGRKLGGQTKTTWHDTGNPSSSALSEWNWAAGGGRANINSPGSYNGIFDKDRIVISQRFDEYVGHAGTDAGNRNWAFEQAFGPGFEASLPVGAALHGGIIAAMGWSVDTALVQHRYWSGKWCPGQILNRGLWPQVQAMVAEAARNAALAAGGTPPPTVTDIGIGDIVATTVSLNLRTEPTTASDIVLTLDPGLEALVLDGPVEAAGYAWWRVRHTSNDGTVEGYVAEGATGTPYLVVTKEAEPEEPTDPEQPAYAKPLAIPELAPYVGRPIAPMPAAILLEGGGIAVPVFDRFRTLRETPRRQQPSGDGRTGPDLPAGAEFDGSFTVIGDGEHAPYLVTPWWTRITLADVEVVSDVPQDIEPAEGQAA